MSEVVWLLLSPTWKAFNTGYTDACCFSMHVGICCGTGMLSSNGLLLAGKPHALLAGLVQSTLASFSSRKDVVPVIHCVTPFPAGTALNVREGRVKLKVMASAAMTFAA